MDFKLTINMDNAAFEDARELARLLDEVAEAVVNDNAGRVRDVNGNTVGRWEITND